MHVLRAAARVALLLIVAAAAFGVAELWMRANRADSVYTEIQRHPPHPFLQAVPAMAVDHVNSQGFRGDDLAVPKPAGTFRIFAIGGSTTLGVSNPYAESYPYLLQTLLREKYPHVNIEVFNAGCPWYTSAHALVSYAVEVRQYEPDLVIFFEAINDLVRSFSPPWLAKGDFKPDYSHYLGPYARLLGPNAEFVDPPSSSLAWNTLTGWLRGSPDPFNVRNPDNVAKVAARLQAIDRPAFRSLPSFRQYSDAIIHFVQADGHAIITASQASLYREDLSAEDKRALWFAPLLCADHGTCPSLTAMTQGMAAYNAAAREIAATRKVPFIDFASAVPKTREYFSDDVHLKKAGNAVLAQKAAEAIEAAGVFRK
ncbi:MAG TPA: SGNH/GDSL hydrolase family protein [Vicinamibacterales bacterium]|nr:SGNH/GDSL hydrolase family protein [Vicinamibacterales bacterium]